MTNQHNVQIKSILNRFEKKHKKDKKKIQCVVENCTTRAISSHSQQQNGQLKVIQENSKVYALHDNLCNTYNIDDGELDFKFELTPISKASTFPGLCNFHDTSIFKCIESGLTEKITETQAATFMYRSNCYERYRRDRELKRHKFLIDNTVDLISYQNWKSLKDKYENDIDDYKKHTLRDLELSYQQLENNQTPRYIHIIVSGNLGVSCCSKVNMHLDRYSENLDSYPERRIPSFSFNIVPDENKTHIVLAWLDKDDQFSSLLKEQTSTNDRIVPFINRLVFCETEDLCIMPSLWDAIRPIHRTKIMKFMEHPNTRGFFINTSDVPIILSNMNIEKVINH